MAEPDVKIALAAELERARAALARSAGSLRQDLDVGAHFKHSFHENKAAFIGGATVFGLLLSKIPARKKKVYVQGKSAGKSTVQQVEKAGIWLILLEFLVKTLRPVLTSLVAKQVTEYVKTRARGGD